MGRESGHQRQLSLTPAAAWRPIHLTVSGFGFTVGHFEAGSSGPAATTRVGDALTTSSTWVLDRALDPASLPWNGGCYWGLVAHESFPFEPRIPSTHFGRDACLYQPEQAAPNDLHRLPTLPGTSASGDIGRTCTIALAELWTQLTNQSLVILDDDYSVHECRMTLGQNALPRPNVSRLARDYSILRRALTGEPRKCIAIDYGIGQSTVSVACAGALVSFGLSPNLARAPMLLVLAAHAANGSADEASGPRGRLTQRGQFWVAYAACPDGDVGLRLSNAERCVMQLFIGGRTRREIALTRRTTERTVANQLAAVFRKFRASSRTELIRRLLDRPAEPAAANLGASQVSRDLAFTAEVV